MQLAAGNMGMRVARAYDRDEVDGMRAALVAALLETARTGVFAARRLSILVDVSSLRVLTAEERDLVYVRDHALRRAALAVVLALLT